MVTWTYTDHYAWLKRAAEATDRQSGQAIAAALARIDELERHPCAQHEADLGAAIERIKTLEGEVAEARAHIVGAADVMGNAMDDASDMRTALSLVSSALADAGVAVGLQEEFGARIAEIAGQRDGARVLLRIALYEEGYSEQTFPNRLLYEPNAHATNCHERGDPDDCSCWVMAAWRACAAQPQSPEKP